MRTRKSRVDPPEQTATGSAPPSNRKRAHAPEDAENPEESTRPKRRRASRHVEPAEVSEKAAEEHSVGAPDGEAPEQSSNGGMPSARENGGDDDVEEIEQQTPRRRKPGRPKAPTEEELDRAEFGTPSKSRRTPGRKPQTPLKQTNGVNGVDTPRRRDLADRSARRKSARTLIDRVMAGATSDDEEGDGGLAREIYESSEAEDDDDGEEPRARDAVEVQNAEEAEEDGDVTTAAETPSKRRPGRPRGGGKSGATTRRRKKSPTPPRDLPPHELYFFQNKPGGVQSKTSANKLSSVGLELLTHDEYFTLLRAHEAAGDHHAGDVEFLQSLHAESFGQWEFELSQGFSVCLFGYGSKRAVLRRFATGLNRRLASAEDAAAGCKHRIVMVNGYVRSANVVREALAAVGRAIDPNYKLPSANPVAAAQGVGALLAAASPPITVTLVVNSIDAPPLRRGIGSTSGGANVTAQAVLAQLASFRPHVRLVCSADTPDFALLWDASLRSQFDFVFHDCTTFAPFSAAEMDVVDDVHELLGRKARRAGGKEGVVFVLRSLPENAKSLFRLLITEVLIALEEDGGGEGGFGGASAEGPGVEYRMLYNKAVEEFICSSEMAFRTLLKEFHDHQIITSRKDALGTELLCLPFRKEELESILEDLMS